MSTIRYVVRVQMRSNKFFQKKNNIEIINYFLPSLKDIEFNYLEVGSHEGLSLLNVLTQYKNVQTTSIDIWSDNIIDGSN